MIELENARNSTSKSMDSKKMSKEEKPEELTIFSIASTRYVVEIYKAINLSFEKMGVSTKNLGLSTDLWYSGNSFQAYKESGFEVSLVPRSKNEEYSWWSSSNIQEELRNDWININLMIRDLIQRWKPNLFIIDDDQGILEASIIKIFKGFEVPVVLFEHGYGFALNQQAKKLESKKIRVKLRKILSKLSSLTQLKPGRKSSSLEESQGFCVFEPFGKNGSDLICCLSGYTKSVLSSYVEPQRIVEVGNPYFDKYGSLDLDNKSSNQIQCQRKNLRADNSKERILVISTGYGKFFNSSKFYYFMQQVLSLGKTLTSSYNLTLRLKPGESQSPLWLLSDFPSILEKLGIQLDDGSLSISEQLLDYDLVIADPNTLVVLESILCNVPSAVLADPKLQLSHSIDLNNPVSLAEIYRFSLNILALEVDKSNLLDQVKLALSPEYLGSLRKNMAGKSSYFLGTFDGSASSRMTQVIINYLKSESQSSTT